MSNYRRAYQKGGCYFFTVVTHGRKKLLARPDYVDRLRAGFRHVMEKRPFKIDAIVILPDHMHCMWRLPENDTDFSRRWHLIKHYFSRGLKIIPTATGEKNVWQRRFWEHLIQDDEDWQRHMDYIHYNPVKHGYVNKPGDWPYGSFQKAVERGFYPEEWGAYEPENIQGMEVE